MTNSADFFRGLSLRAGALAVLGLFLFAIPHGDTLAADAKRNVKFDHIKTGFPLTGAHVTLPCETCHVQGTFKGTPKKCETCHTPGSRIQSVTVKPANHIPTNQACSQCHSSTASWKVARFTHVGVAPHQCGQCHNNSIAPGKPANHMRTSEPCDACHRTTTWMSASFTHVSVMPGSCTQCHIQGGTAKTFKSSDHIPTTRQCDACHTTGGSFSTSRFTHSATQGVVAGQCSTCHNGSYTQWNALGKHATHVATTASCDTCHTGFATFAGANQHAGVIASAGTCANAGCHAPGGAGTPKASDHIPTGLTCNQCHNMTTFTPSSFTHTAALGVMPGQCATSGCHDGTHTSSNAQGKPANHPITSASCDTCHTGYTTFAGLSSKPANHIPTTLACSACHTGSNYTISSFTHSATQGVTPGQCATCHNGAYTQWNALGKPSNHIPTNLSCDACHTTGGTFTTSTFTHSATQGIIAGQCATCHNGSYTQWNALGKHATHVATTASCDTCHTGYATFAGAGFNHTGVAPGSCATCHNGSQAIGKPNGHMVTARACDSCHHSTATGGFQLPVTYSHTSPYFTTHSSGVNAICLGCHKANTETIAGVTAYEPPNCYACHAGDFKPGSHKKTEVPTTILYTAVELRNCAGSCHQYTNNTFTTILRSRSGEHRATSGGF